MKKLLIALLAASSITAFADDLYVGGAAGATWNNVATGNFAFRINGGYNFNDALSVELGMTNIAQGGSGELNQNMQFWDLSVKGTLPLADSFALYGQLGGAYGIPGVAAEPTGNTGSLYKSVTVNQDAWDILAGAGVQFNLTKKTAITVGDYYYFGSTQAQGNTNVVLAGLKYNF